MKAGTITLIAFLAALAVGVLIAVTSYISANNYGVRAEAEIKAAWENNENVLAQYGQKISEAAQIPGMQRDDLTKIFTESLGARYGANGSQAAMQWIKEQNPNLDQSTYLQLQRMIEAGRNEFRAAQTQLIDKKRSYETNLGYFWRGFWMERAGFPKIDLAKYRAITTERASNAFQTGREEPMKLR